MLHPADTKLPLVFKVSNEPAPVKKLVERNVFGCAFNILLAIVWFSLLLYILGSQYKSFDILKFQEHFNTISQGILLLACLFLGGFHAYILTKDKKDTDTHKWPLVFGTFLYTVAISLVYIEYRTANVREYDTNLYTSFTSNEKQFSIQNLFLFLIFLCVPLTFCVELFFENSNSHILSPWTIKKIVIPSRIPTESTTDVHEFNLAGFIISIALILIWFVMTVVISYVFCFKEIIIPEIMAPIFFLILTCSLVICGVHIYALLTPEFDSGDAPDGFIHKNWLMASCCSLVIITSIFGSISAFNYGIPSRALMVFLIIASCFILLSLCSCFVMIPSNSSRSFTRAFKPWNTLKRTVVNFSV